MPYQYICLLVATGGFATQARKRSWRSRVQAGERRFQLRFALLGVSLGQTPVPPAPVAEDQVLEPPLGSADEHEPAGGALRKGVVHHGAVGPLDGYALRNG